MFVLEIVVVYVFCVVGGFQTGLQWVVLAILARKKQKCQAFGHVLYYWTTSAVLWVSYFSLPNNLETCSGGVAMSRDCLFHEQSHRYIIL